MHPIRLLPLLSLALAAPASAQGVLVPLRCVTACHALPPDVIDLDSVAVSARVENDAARVHVNHIFRNDGATGTMDGAFFFPLPAHATLSTVSVFVDGTLTQYNDWSRDEESRWILDGAAATHRRSGLEAYRRGRVVHVPVLSIPPDGTIRVQLTYTEMLPKQGDAFDFRYPLAGGARPRRPAALNVVVEVRTENGFSSIASPSHEVAVRHGTERAPCPPEAACGWRGVPSERARIVRLTVTPDARARDFVLMYTPSATPVVPVLRIQD